MINCDHKIISLQNVYIVVSGSYKYGNLFGKEDFASVALRLVTLR